MTMTEQQLDTRIAILELNYQNLDKRLEKVEDKIDELHDDMKNGNSALIKAIVGAAGTIAAGAISVVVAILMKF